eukprot:TRINITY_DN788_c0_g1_i6.p1 TRINITY_DN788_c0_g1~~TRINITY_DN788_c0_g1_i6.p1  ORF type:complete len:586 (+),score=149.36 TRINITY_DN788_c0_g1_i6:83-1840(+)
MAYRSIACLTSFALTAQASAEAPFLRGRRTGEVTGSLPSWCGHIPAASQKYVADCGGTASTGTSSSGTPPSWCDDIPEIGRQHVADCVDTSGTSSGSTGSSSTGSLPSWCGHIPAASQKYVADCGGTASTGTSSSGTPPSWCDDIPEIGRQHVADCVDTSGTSSGSTGSSSIVSEGSGRSPRGSSSTVSEDTFLRSVADQIELPKNVFTASGTHFAQGYHDKAGEEINPEGMFQDCYNINLNKKLSHGFRKDVFTSGNLTGFFYHCERVGDRNKYWFTIAAESEAEIKKLCDDSTKYPIVYDAQHNTFWKDFPFTCEETDTSQTFLQDVAQQVGVSKQVFTASGTHFAQGYHDKAGEDVNPKGMFQDCYNINLNKKLSHGFRKDVFTSGNLTGFFYHCERVGDRNKYWFTIAAESEAEIKKLCDDSTKYPIVYDAQHATWWKDFPFTCENADASDGQKSTSANTATPAAAGSDGAHESTPTGSDKTPATGSDDEGTAQCYNNGTPGLSDGQCEMSYSATPGKEVYSFSVPGSASKYACCDRASASECYIKPTPGGLNPGETFDCTPQGTKQTSPTGGRPVQEFLP